MDSDNILIKLYLQTITSVAVLFPNTFSANTLIE